MTDTQEEQLPPKKEITAEEFIKIWKGEYKGIDGYNDYYKYDWQSQYHVMFNNHTIIGKIKVEKSENLHNVRFINSIIGDFEMQSCSFGYIIMYNSTSGNFEIDDCKCGSFEITEGSKTGYFEFLNGSKIGDFEVSGNSCINNFYLYYNSITDGIKISGHSIARYFNIENSQTGYIKITENSLAKDFYIKDNSTIGDFEISHNTVLGSFMIVSSEIGQINITEKSTVGRLDVVKNSIVKSIAINNQSSASNISINKSSVETINIYNGAQVDSVGLSYLNEASKSFTLAGGTLSHLLLQIDIPYQITIRGYYENNNNSQFSRAILHNLHLSKGKFPKDAILHISRTDINKIVFSSFLNFGTIVFSDIQYVDELKIFEANNNKYIKGDDKCYKIKEEIKQSAFIIHNSDLGNMQFIGCNIAGFKRFEFLNSKMAHVFLADTLLPHRKHIYTAVNADLNEQRRLALSQFKKIYENQGDIVKAVEYRAEEMEVYRQYLWKTKGVKNRWIEFINLSFNRFSSYYGSNWLRAACVTLVVTWTFFTIYCFALGTIFGTDWDEFTRLFSYSFEFLNPIRKNSTLVDEEKVTPLARIIDYIGRVFIAYFVYQTIQAFRKFGKSST